MIIKQFKIVEIVFCIIEDQEKELLGLSECPGNCSENFGNLKWWCLKLNIKQKDQLLE